MENCCSTCLIVLGAFILLMEALMTFGFNFIFKASIPIAMSLLPFNESLRVFTEIPLALDVKTLFTHFNTSNELTNRTLGLVQLGFKIEMESWADESPVIPILWLQETGNLAELSRYLILLSDGPLNYAKYLCWSFAGFSITLGIFGVILWFMNR